MRDPSVVDRRRMLGGVATALGVGLSGCNTALPTGNAPQTTTGKCEDRGPARTPFDQSLLPLRAGECAQPRLRFVSVAPSARLGTQLFVPALHPLSQFARKIALPLSNIDRAGYVRVPNDGFLQSAVFRTDVDRELYRTRLTVDNHYVSDAGTYRSFDVYTSPTNTIRTFGMNQTWIAVTPVESGGVDMASRARFEHAADALAGEVSDYPCAYADVRTLLDSVSHTDLVQTEFRVAPGTVGGDRALPAGSRAGALAVTVRNSTRKQVAVDLRFAAIYPEREVKRATFETYVQTHRTTGDAATLGFDNPAFERSGRILTARESRTISVPEGST